MNNMNIKLKLKIIEKFGSQADFAGFISEHEALISRVIRCRHDLSAQKKQKWAEALGCRTAEIFSPSEPSKGA